MQCNVMITKEAFKMGFHLHGLDRKGSDRIKIFYICMRFSVVYSIDADPERILKSLKKVQRFFDPMTGSEQIDFTSQ